VFSFIELTPVPESGPARVNPCLKIEQAAQSGHQLCFLPATDEYVDPVLWFREVLETWCYLSQFMAAELKFGEKAY
jgi:hypothetical protein